MKNVVDVETIFKKEVSASLDYCSKMRKFIVYTVNFFHTKKKRQRTPASFLQKIIYILTLAKQ